MTLPQLLLSALLAGAPQQQQQLPTDPFQRTAHKALAGDFGPLADWQRTGYQLGLDRGVTATARLVTTQYNGDEPDGVRDRYGNACSLRHCAVAKRLVLQRGSGWERAFVWTPRGGLRQVLDCGANSNERTDGYRRALDAAGWTDARWVDVWWSDARQARRNGFDGWTPMVGAVVGR